ncbi:MAG: hypothetical protein HY820_33275 [Acidobacteria bacterium]|nr:hypothetical protein [Acidobacteriota bacterium]
MFKRNIAGVALMTFWLSGTILAQPQCGSQHLVGVWSASAIGWTIPTASGPWPTGETLPTVGVGLISIDHSGKLSGPGTVVFAGLVLDYEMVGTVSVNSDCAGLIKYTVKIKGFPDLGGYVERFVLDVTRQEIVTASVRSPISKPMWVMTMKRISAVPAAATWPELPAQN